MSAAEELGRLADANLAQTWEMIGRAMGAAVGQAESAVFVSTGFQAAFFNGVYATAPVLDPDAVIRDAIRVHVQAACALAALGA